MPPAASSRDITKSAKEKIIAPPNIKQRFNFATDCSQVIEGISLAGKTALVTGGTSGIGVETARALAKAGAHVFITARDPSKAKSVVEDIIKSTGNSKVESIELQLESLASVRKCAADFLARNLPLHIVICNAGIMAVPTLTKTVDGFEQQLGTNHLSHFLLVNLLLPAVKSAGKGARIVCLSSSAHRYSPFLFDNYNFDKPDSYQKWVSYGQSKTANILFAVELNRRLSPCGITANALHPGGIMTGLQTHVSEEERATWEKFLPFFKNVTEGAATTIWAAVAPELEGVGGYYFEDTWFSPIVPPTETEAHYGVCEYALDPEAAKKLWDLSVKLTGLEQTGCCSQNKCS